MKKILTTGLALAVGVAIYDYFVNGAIDWFRAPVIGLIGMGILYLDKRFRK